MKNPRVITTVIYIIICSVTVLVMLTTSFELFKEKYLPSFMLAQKYALPIIISAMAITYLTFFEPEQFQNNKVMLYVRIGFVITLGSFAFFLFTLNLTTVSKATVAVYWMQLAATTMMTNSLFKK